VIIDALVLAGGRSSRLGGVPKSSLMIDGRSLLDTALGAAAFVRCCVVVGDDDVVAEAARRAAVTVVRESPPFAGPAAAIAAGVGELAERSSSASDFTLVLACDMPRVDQAVRMLVAALRADSDGAVAVSADGRVQSLAALYSTSGLVIAAHVHAGELENLSVRALLGDLHPDPVDVPAGSTDDIDTWDDAEEFGAHQHPTEECT